MHICVGQIILPEKWTSSQEQITEDESDSKQINRPRWENMTQPESTRHLCHWRGKKKNLGAQKLQKLRWGPKRGPSGWEWGGRGGGLLRSHGERQKQAVSTVAAAAAQKHKWARAAWNVRHTKPPYLVCFRSLRRCWRRFLLWRMHRLKRLASFLAPCQRYLY